MSRSYYVYIISSKSGVLYIGSTNDLWRRVLEHKQGLLEGFTKRYRVTRLSTLKSSMEASDLLARATSERMDRRRKLELIHTQNPEMLD